MMGLFFTLCATGVFADQSDYYYLHISVGKVFTHKLGYRLTYSPSVGVIKDLYIPLAWVVPGGKAEMISDHGPQYPYLEVFYKNGKFDHVRLYVESDMNGPTWGTLPATVDLTQAFAVEELTIEH